MRVVKTIILFLILLPQLSNAQIITTIAGTGVAGYNGDGIAATSAQITNPSGIAIDAAGNIYIGDFGISRIRKITISTGLISTIAGTSTPGYNGDGILATLAQISNPSDLTFDSNGDLYFTDRTNRRVRKITTSTGIISTVAGTGTAGYNGDGIPATSATLDFPNTVIFDAGGNMLIADWGNARVRKVDKVTGLISTIAGTGTGGYNGDGILATSAQLNTPTGLALDNAGNIYIAEFDGCRIRKITITTGLISTIAGTGTAGYNGDGILATSAQLYYCDKIRVDAAENIYIGDPGNNRIRVITKSTSIINTIAGTGTGGYNGDGIPATTAQLWAPFSIYFDKLNCNMYIADYYNNRIRKVTGGFAGCPSPVAPGNLVSCLALPAVQINPGNNNSWVPVFDSSGNIAAMINGNGNNLGTVSINLYTKNGACREDGSHRLYLNRNITITPQNQPSSAVSVRLYILKSELDSLRTALNSLGQPSGVASINEVDVFKNSDACATVGTVNAVRLAATNSTYNADYYLQVSISSFSSFYFANKLLTAILPVKIISFTGKRTTAGNTLQWNANCNGAVDFYIERSTNGIDFTTIGNIAATNCNQLFNYIDNSFTAQQNYYRLKIIESGQVTGYSPVVVIQLGKSNTRLSMLSSFVKGSAIIVYADAENAETIQLVLTDITARLILQKAFALNSGSNTLSIDVGHLAAGIYWIYSTGKNGKTNTLRFIKQ